MGESDEKQVNETYLGDSACLSFDGQMLWLRTSDDNNQWIALELLTDLT
jgi:hypothetical protein